MSIPTVALNETTPAGSAYVRDGDDRIKEYKKQVREILEIDHYCPSSGQSASCGRHKQMTLIEAADIGTGGGVGTGVAYLGAQTVSGQPELTYTDEDNDDVQITDGGKVKTTDTVKLTGDQTVEGTKTLNALKLGANMECNDKQALNFILENRTNDTGMTVTGQMWFRTDV